MDIRTKSFALLISPDEELPEHKKMQIFAGGMEKMGIETHFRFGKIGLKLKNTIRNIVIPNIFNAPDEEAWEELCRAITKFGYQIYDSDNNGLYIYHPDLDDRIEQITSEEIID